MSSAARKWVGWLGAILIAVYFVASWNAGPSLSELLLATQPVVRVPLDLLHTTAKTTAIFTVPETPEWNKWRRSWGEPRYIAFVSGRDRSIRPYGSLGLTIRALVGGRALPIGPITDPPYAYSSQTTDYGVAFRAAPGVDVLLDVEASAPGQLRDGELVVEPQWPGALKDRIVGAMVEESLRPYVSLMGAAGVLLTVVGLLVGRRDTA